VSDQAREQRTRRLLHEAMHAILSDDHNYERGLASLRDLVDRVLREGGATGLMEFAVALSTELAGALERIAADQGLAAADLAEVWFAD
jgi:hypothetical protein